ncbi:MAG: hypothetical protein M3Y87_33405 [Myxococcota bacterium]|nr:hypothetical protein [Myxococcota bacterium]
MDEPIDPGLAIVVATGGMVAFFGLWNLWQRRLAARRRAVLEESARIELPSVSEVRRTVIVLSIVSLPMTAWVIGFIALDRAREHALLVVLGALVWTALGIVLGLVLSERYARVGALVLEGSELALSRDDGRPREVLDLDDGFTLTEWESIPMRGPHVVGVTVAQGARRVTFVYPPWGARVTTELAVTTSSPFAASVLGGEAAALHARLRAHPARQVEAPTRNEAVR